MRGEAVLTSNQVQVIVMGGSAGALDALFTILPALPRQFTLPIALVLHIPPDRPSYLPSVLGAKCHLGVHEVDDKEPIVGGNVYVAPPSYHLLLERQRRFSLSVDEPVHFSRPSIDVLFESAVEAFGAAVVGVLLSGANEDGAQGLTRIRRAGGMAVVQAPATAAAPCMPEAALRVAGADRILSPAAIGAFLADLARPALVRLERS